MPCAVAARNTIPVHHTQVQIHLGRSDMHRGLFLYAVFPDRSGRTHLSAAVALHTTPSALIRHLRLHKMLQRRRRAQHPVGTLRHTELTGRAMLVELLDTQRSERNQRSLPHRRLLPEYNRQSAVHLLLLRLHCQCPKGQCRSADKCTSSVISGLSLVIDLSLPHWLYCLRRLSGLPERLVFYRALMTGADAVETVHAPAVVDSVIVQVNA